MARGLSGPLGLQNFQGFGHPLVEKRQPSGEHLRGEDFPDEHMAESEAASRLDDEGLFRKFVQRRREPPIFELSDTAKHAEAHCAVQ